MKLLICSLLCHLAALQAAEVAFPSGEYFKILESPPAGYEDPEKTGSLVLEEPYTGSRLSFFVPSSRWYKKDQNSVFRAHPVFLECLETVLSDLSSQDIVIDIVKGFLSSKELSGSSSEWKKYHQAGTAAELKIRSGSSGDLLNVVSSFMKVCPRLFSQLGQDFGVALGKQSVTFFLQGTVRDTEWIFRNEGSDLVVGGDAELKSWFLQKLGEVFLEDSDEELVKCAQQVSRSDVKLTTGTAKEVNAVIGKADEAIKKEAVPDFLRLLQYPSRQVQFPDCLEVKGTSLNAKCNARLMAPREFLAMKKLEFLTARTHEAWKLKVLRGWTPSDSNSSHYNEGRMVTLTLTSPTEEALKQLEKIASLCAGFDYTRRSASEVVLGVQRQETLVTKPVDFDDGTSLTPVYVPRSKKSDYDVAGVEEVSYEDYPLFDATLDPSMKIGFVKTLGDFISKSPEFTYFRLHPALVSCFDDVVEMENRGLEESKPVGLNIDSGFMPELEERSKMDPFSDHRIGLFSLGVGLQISYDSKSPGFDAKLHTSWRLAKSVSTICAPKFTKEEKKIGLGIYNSSIFVGMQKVRKIWLECDSDKKSSYSTCHLKTPEVEGFEDTTKVFLEYMREFTIQSERGWVLNPADAKDACRYDYPPERQSPYYVYKEKPERPLVNLHKIDPDIEDDSEFFKASSDECATDAEFCSKSFATRKTWVTHLWEDISTKHLLAGNQQVRDVLEKCLLACSGCSFGAEWQAKVAACTKLAHWIPFDFENDLDDAKTNIYPGGDEELRKRACFLGEHCLDWAPIFGLLNPAVSAMFRPSPEGAIKEALYEQGNPIPLVPILRRLYAFYAVGEVKVWLRHDGDVLTLENSLKPLMLYNKNVTFVNFYVLDEDSLITAASAIESMATGWMAHACPANSREYIAPFNVQLAPKEVAFSSAYDTSFEMRERMRAEHEDKVDIKNW